MNNKSAVKNRVLRAQAREIIHSVLKFTQEEAAGNQPLIEFHKIQERVAALTGVSLSTVKKIAKEGRDIEDGQRPGFSTPNKRRKISSKIQLDGCDQGILRRFIYNLYLTEQQVPTIKKIHKKFVEEMNYTGSKESMRNEFHKLGFRWKKTVNNRNILIEKHEIRHLRLQYLRHIKKAREEKRFIVFTDETYLPRKPLSKGESLIIVGAGNENGFLPGTYLRWKSTSKSGYYQDDINFNNYKKWLQEQLLCNLPQNSVIVLDNAPYHNTQEEKCPTSTARKSVMQEWLRIRNIPFDDSMLKPDLYNIIKLHKPCFIKYTIDKIIRDEGHEVVRLPPYHPDLNPIEMVWAALKSYVSARNVEITFQSIENLCDEFFQSFSAEEWRKLTEKVIEIECDLIAKEPLIDIVIDEIINNLAEDPDSEDFQSDSDSEDSSDNFI